MDDLETLNISDQKKRYVREVLNPLLEDVVMDSLFAAKLDQDPTNYLLAWCNLRRNTISTQYDALLSENLVLKEKLKQGGRALAALETAAVIKSKRLEDERIAAEAASLTAATGGLGGAEDDAGGSTINQGLDELGSEDLLDEEELLDEADLPGANAGRNSRARRAVAKGVEPVPELVSVPKSESQRKRLRKALAASVLFQSCSDEVMTKILDVMSEEPYEPDDVVFRANDTADFLLVVERGSLESRGQDAQVQPQARSIVQHTEKKENLIGEQALLHHITRDATCVCTGETTVCWKLLRSHYHYILQKSAQLRRDKILKHFARVPLLAKVEQNLKIQLAADGVTERVVKAGQNIIVQNDVGTEFFMLETGKAAVTSAGAPASASSKAPLEYGPGDFFGELALLEEAPRAATVQAVADCEMFVLSKNAFARLLGGSAAFHDMVVGRKEEYQGDGAAATLS